MWYQTLELLLMLHICLLVRMAVKLCKKDLMLLVLLEAEFLCLIPLWEFDLQTAVIYYKNITVQYC